MSRTAYPTHHDLEALLIASGLRSITPTTIEQVLDLQGAISSAIADWEQDTGLVPFVKDAADVTLYYDPPGQQGRDGIFGSARGISRSLYLPSQNGSVFASITSVTIGYSTNSPGTLLTLNQDYYLEPRNAALNNRPYEWITFVARQFGTIGSIVVVGKRGWPVVPDNAYRAVTVKAGLTLAPEIQANLTQGVLMMRVGDDEERYSEKPLQSTFERWGTQYTDAVGKYRQVTL